MENEKDKIENEDDVTENYDFDFDPIRNDYQIESEAEIK